MLSYYLKCKKNTQNIDAKMMETKNARLMLLSKFTVCSKKESRFMKEQEAEGLLSSLGIRTPLSESPLLNVVF